MEGEDHRLEQGRGEPCPKPIKNKTEQKTDPTKYKKRGCAGVKGVDYQIRLIATVMLNVMKSSLTQWKISTENEAAEKFDDIVVEWTEGAVLVQSKHRENSNKRITLEDLTSTNSKNDFSLPMYFLCSMLIKKKFNIKNLIICTNANIDKDALKFLNRQTTDTESLLHYEDGECSFYTLIETFMPVLKEKSIEYFYQNFKNKGIQESDITDENLSDFLKCFQLFVNYPSLTDLEKITNQLLSVTECCSNSQGLITEKEIYPKVMDWLQQKQGVYLTETHIKAMFAETWADRYCKKLQQYKVSLQRNDLNFPDPKQIFYVSCSQGYLLQAIKVYYAVQNEEILFVNPDDDLDTQKLILEAFALPKYVFLVINRLNVMEESVIKETCAKLQDILSEKKYKKVILMTSNNDDFSSILEHSEIHYEFIDRPVTFTDFSKEFQQELVKRKSLVFQGKSVCLEELLAGDTTEGVDQGILENIVKGEILKVGVQPLDMDKNIAPFYINRTFKRSMENVYEEDIYDVKEKVVLISDNAGVGKTTVLSKLATDIKERHPHLWVIKIALTEYTKLLRELKDRGESICIRKLLDSKEATKFTNDLESFVFSIKEKVVLMLDGVDEISPDYTELVHNLLTQCQQATNFAKVFVTTRPHMAQETKEILKVDPFELQPFTEQDQVDFLGNYWAHNLAVAPEDKEKCDKYARALIEAMSSWTQAYRYGEDEFTAVALQLRMVAEIFQETMTLNESLNWKGCKEYLEGTNESPKLPEKMELKELYDLFIERKRRTYIMRGNPTGNSEANKALIKHFKECLAYHQKLALAMTFSEEDCELFSLSQESCEEDIIESVLRIGIVQRANEFYFIHRTFAEYFVAETLFSELRLQSRNPNLKFQEFFIDEMLGSRSYEVIHGFLDSFLQDSTDSIPSNTFETYQSDSTNFGLLPVDHWVINFLAGEGRVAILELILKCIDFENIRNESRSVKQKNTKLENLLGTVKREHMAVNTLNALKIVLRDVGLEIRDLHGRTPLMAAAARGHLKMAMFLVGLGAKANSADEDGFTALHWAVESGHTDIVEYLVQQDAGVDCRSRKGYTPLHLAAVRSDFECVEYLLRSKADVTIRDKRGRTVLHFAALGKQFYSIDFLRKSDVNCFDNFTTRLTVGKEQLAIITYLAESGGDTNIKDENGCTALHYAAKFSHVDTIKRLRELGGNLNIRNNHGQVALHWAAESDHFHVVNSVEYLVEFNRDVDIKDNDGCTPLLLAASRGHVGVVQFLQQQNASISVRDNRGRTVLHVAAEKGHLDGVKYLVTFIEDVDTRDNHGRTPLLLAASRGHVEVVEFLRQQNANVDVRDHRGRTVLHASAENGCINEYFIECVADITARDDCGCTALHSVAEECQMDAINCLCKMFVNLDIENDDDKTPLHLAAERGYSRLVTAFYELGAHLNIRDGSGRTALHSAAASGHLNVVKYLQKAGADLNITDNRGEMALHSAAVFGHLGIVKFLLTARADLNITDNFGKTALHSAASVGYLDAVESLREAGADLNIIDDDGRTPLHSAAANGHLSVVKYLLEEGVDCIIKDKDDRTPAQLARFKRHIEVVDHFQDTKKKTKMS